MQVFHVLRVFWSMLGTRQRWAVSAMLSLLFVTGLLEMAGMVLIFAYIRGLALTEDGGRAGPLAQALEWVLGGPLSDVAYVAIGGVALVGFMVVKNAMGTVTRYLINRFVTNVTRRVARDLFRGYLLSPYEQLRSIGSSLPTEKIGKVFDVFGASFLAAAQIVSDSAILIMVAGLLLFVEPLLTLGGAVLFALAGVGLYATTRHSLNTLAEEESVAQGHARRRLKEGLMGVVETRLHDTRDYFVSRFSRALEEAGRIRRKKEVYGRLPRSINEVTLAIMVVGAVLYLTMSGRRIEDALPLLAIFGFAGMRLTAAMSRIGTSVQGLRRRADHFDAFCETLKSLSPRVFSLVGQIPRSDYLREESEDAAAQPLKLQDRVALQGVTFTYPGVDAPAVVDVSLEVPRGKFVSFCGPSGGGKSTLALLFMGLMKPQEGRVTCDGKNVFEHIRAWHRNLGYVGQQTFLSPSTIRENVAFGVAPDRIDERRVEEVLRLASAWDFVSELEQGTHTPIGEGGSRLSGGQRQRIAIARALYPDPEILVFDEATAALDNVTEREVTAALARLSGTKTLLCIAHRLSTIRDSDMIHVLVDGRIDATGSYDELLTSSPEFQRLARTETE